MLVFSDIFDIHTQDRYDIHIQIQESQELARYREQTFIQLSAKDTRMMGLCRMQTQALSRMESSLAEAYRSHQQKAREDATQQQQPGLVDELGGTTALVAMLLGDILHVANIGDCRAVLCRRNEDGQPEAIPLSTDHTPELEMARINATGFEVSLFSPSARGHT